MTTPPPRRTSLSRVKLAATMIVAAVVISAFILVTPKQTGTPVSSTHTTTAPAYPYGVVPVGICRVTSYFVPDVEAILTRNVTTTYGNTTTYYISASYIYPRTEALKNSTYTTIAQTNTYSTYTITSTSPSDYNNDDDDPCSPSACWSVTICTYAP